MRTPETETPINLTALTTRLNEFAGFDLSDSEAALLLNEGRREAARRSRYPRKVKEIGPTVAEQEAYSLPADFLLPESLAVAARPWESSDLETVRQYKQGELILLPYGVWYERPDEEGVRKLYLYPAPGEAGLAVELEYVYQPVDLVNDGDEPSEFPEFWHPNLRFFAAQVYYETIEDNADLAEVFKGRADTAIGDLIRYDNERSTGNGIFQVRISGVNA